MPAKMPQTMSECFELMEAEMFNSPWVTGDDSTICDPYLFTVSNWLKGDGVGINNFPAIADFNHRMREREAVKPVLELYGLSQRSGRDTMNFLFDPIRNLLVFPLLDGAPVVEKPR
ncbi:MAG: hypothetical protein PsegKO_10960 [Pseudohongiellaceae bacterium]